MNPATHPTLILILILALTSCSPPEPANGTQKAEPENTKTTAPQAPVIHDTSQYDPEFISGLASCSGPLVLNGSNIISGSDTAYFPALPALNQEHVMKTNMNGEKFEIKLQRHRLSSLDYSMTQTSKNNMSVTRNSKAFLSPCFFQSNQGKNAEFIDGSGECQVNILVLPGKKSGTVKVEVRYGCDNPVTLTFE